MFHPALNHEVIQDIKIQVPASTSWQPKQVEQFTVSLFSLPVSIALRLVANPVGITWHVLVERAHAESVVNSIYAYYPDAHLLLEPKLAADTGYFGYRFNSTGPFIAPLKYADDLTSLDPLVGILGALTDLRANEEVIYELLLKPISEEHYQLGQKMITDSRVKWWHFLTPGRAALALSQKALGWDKVDRFTPEIQKIVEAKFNGQLRHAIFSLKIKALRPERARYLESLVGPGLSILERPGFNALVPEQRDSFPLVLCPREVAGLWHLPTQDCMVPGIQWALSVASPLPTELTYQEDGVLLGQNLYQGRLRQVHLAYDDRVTHVNLIGKTRVGKSTLLHQMAHQDIKAGKGVGVIDPHGDLVKEILSSSIPHSREQDVVLLDVEDREHVIGLNLLATPQSVPLELAAGQALSVIRHLFAEQWSATRMEDALYAALIALMSTRDATLLDIPRLFNSDEFREGVLERVCDPVTLDFWRQEYEPLSDSFKREIARPVNSRIRKFYRNEALRRMVCQSGCLDFQGIMDSGKIFLANLRGAGGVEGETLGALLISKLQMAAMSRARDENGVREPYYLYIDEAQNFITASLPTMFSEAG